MHKELTNINRRLIGAYNLKKTDQKKWLDEILNLEDRKAYLLNKKEWDEKTALDILKNANNFLSREWFKLDFKIDQAGKELLTRLDLYTNIINIVTNKRNMAAYLLATDYYLYIIDELIIYINKKNNNKVYKLPIWITCRSTKKIEENYIKWIK